MQVLSTISSKTISMDFIKTRCETRINLPVILYLRRAINQSSYQHTVKTENVSNNGAAIIGTLPLSVGTKLHVSAFNGGFVAIAIVRHVTYRGQDQWAMGIEFVTKAGKWMMGN